MALVRIGLASLEMDSVSHARVSADRDNKKNEINRHLVTFFKMADGMKMAGEQNIRESRVGRFSMLVR